MGFQRSMSWVPLTGVLSLTLVLAGCSLFSPAEVDLTDRDEAGEIVGEGTLGVFSFEVGDCLNELDIEPAEEAEVVDASGVPCDDPHVYEVYYEESLEGLSLQEIKDAQPQICEDEFEEFVGMSYWDTSLEITYLFPTEESFSQGDKSIQCLVSTGDLSMVAGSLRGMGESYQLVASKWGEVGECLDVVYDSSGNPVEERYVSCDEPHIFELFFVGTASSEPLDDIRIEITDFCLEEWDRYKAPGVNSDDYFISPMAPTDETYVDGDREVACLVHTESYDPIVGSLAK
jgi:hypothetical protein